METDIEEKYLKDPSNNKIVKVISETEMFYVQVVSFKNGTFVHQRGKTVLPEQERVSDYLTGYIPATKNDYIEMMKNYYSIDLKARHRFATFFNIGQ